MRSKMVEFGVNFRPTAILKIALFKKWFVRGLYKILPIIPFEVLVSLILRYLYYLGLGGSFSKKWFVFPSNSHSIEILMKSAIPCGCKAQR